MIKANELRIGNCIKGMYGNCFVHTIAMISGEYVLSYMNSQFSSSCDGLIDLKDCNPIPLTREILEKFGWIWNEEANSFEKYPNGDARMHFQYREVNGSFTMFNYVLKALIAEKLYYVHQLQNLYFALTGEELPIQL
jgi:hypothetical protein